MIQSYLPFSQMVYFMLSNDTLNNDISSSMKITSINSQQSMFHYGGQGQNRINGFNITKTAMFLFIIKLELTIFSQCLVKSQIFAKSKGHNIVYNQSYCTKWNMTEDKSGSMSPDWYYFHI